MKVKRNWNAYEINQLTKHGFDPFEKYEENIPVEYITNSAEFLGRDFYVDQNVLIPRVETEKLVELSLSFPHQKPKRSRRSEGLLKKDTVKSPRKKITFADIGTGSGVIGLTFALEMLKRNIDFNGYLVDTSEKALEITKLNRKKLFKGIKRIKNSEIKIVKSDLLTNLKPYLKFDLIIANLPYIPTERLTTLDKSVKDFEPEIALDGGEDGLEIIRKLLEQAKPKIKRNGVILLEVDDTHDLNKTKEFKNDYSIEVLKDENEKIRFWVLKPKY